MVEKFIELAIALQKAYRDPDAQDMIKDEFKARRTPGYHPSTGFSYQACEAINNLLDLKDSSFKFHAISAKLWEHGPHNFYKCKDTGKIFDPTAAQFVSRGIEIPYDLGRQCTMFKGKFGEQFTEIVRRYLEN